MSRKDVKHWRAVVGYDAWAEAVGHLVVIIVPFASEKDAEGVVKELVEEKEK